MQASGNPFLRPPLVGEHVTKGPNVRICNGSKLFDTVSIGANSTVFPEVLLTGNAVIKSNTLVVPSPSTFALFYFLYNLGFTPIEYEQDKWDIKHPVLNFSSKTGFEDFIT